MIPASILHFVYTMNDSLSHCASPCVCHSGGAPRSWQLSEPHIKVAIACRFHVLSFHLLHNHSCLWPFTMSLMDIVIIRRGIQTQPQTPGASATQHDRILSEGDEEFDMVASSWKAMTRIICSPRGQRALAILTVMWNSSEDNVQMITQPQVSLLVGLFIDKLHQTTPMLVIGGVGNPHVVAYHPRGSWEGPPEAFEVRRQSFTLNQDVSNFQNPNMGRVQLTS